MYSYCEILIAVLWRVCTAFHAAILLNSLALVMMMLENYDVNYKLLLINLNRDQVAFVAQWDEMIVEMMGYLKNSCKSWHIHLQLLLETFRK